MKYTVSLCMLLLVAFGAGCTHVPKHLQYKADESLLLKLYEKNNEYPAPIVSLTDWGCYDFLLYPDGLLIKRRAHENRHDFTTLDQSQLNSILGSILQRTDFFDLSSRYDLTGWSDQPKHTITIDYHDVRKSVTVYGSLAATHNDRLKETVCPPAFLELYRFLRDYGLHDRVLYDAGYLEITVADYSYAPEASLEWPKDWPDMDSRLARATPGYGVIEYMILFPSDQADALDQFLAKRNTRGAVLMNGRKMSVGYRRPFPGEKKWSSWKQ